MLALFFLVPRNGLMHRRSAEVGTTGATGGVRAAACLACLRLAERSTTGVRARSQLLPIFILLGLSLLLWAGCVAGPPEPPTACGGDDYGTPHAMATPSPSPELPEPRTATVPPSPEPTPTPTATPLPTATPTHLPVATALLPSSTPTTVVASPTTPTPTVNPTAVPQAFVPVPPAGRSFATLDDFWAGTAEWVLEAHDVGLPVGESDTVHRGGGEFWSYLHASHQSAGVVDTCGSPVPFPGCITLWKSRDGGMRFFLEDPVCLFTCSSCPCDPGRDHPGQQQYPRVFFDTDRAYIVYEWGAGTYLRTSPDGLHWSAEAHVPGTGQWRSTMRACGEVESIGDHPNIYDEAEYGDCLVGAPPGLIIEGDFLYVFVGLGRNPGHMGCYVGDKSTGAGGLRKCTSNPLFGAEHGYGPLEARGADANPFFEFRTISSADVVKEGERYYMTYEGVRGPSHSAVVDDQFALGLARSTGPTVDGPWEKYPQNPIIMDVANNWGVGHADLLIVGPATYLYTATSQTTRGRYVLVRR